MEEEYLKDKIIITVQTFGGCGRVNARLLKEKHFNLQDRLDPKTDLITNSWHEKELCFSQVPALFRTYDFWDSNVNL